MQRPPRPLHRIAQLWQRVPHRRAIAIGAATFATVAAAFAFVGAAWLVRTTPDAAAVAERAQVRPTRIVTADGQVLTSIGERQSHPVGLDNVSPYVVKALLATEDRRFYDHHGIDLRRTAAAIWNTACGNVQGGSTLTQQLARNLFPRRIGNERSLLRKLREVTLAMKIEGAYDKDQILALYLSNQVPFLYDVSGIEMAARTYFGKPAKALELPEAALLVAMLKGPQRYDPVRAPERALKRRNLVLSLMSQTGAIDGAEAMRAQVRPLGVHLVRRNVDPSDAPHYVLALKRQLADWAAKNGVDPARDGLTVHATLDARLQSVAQQAVDRQSALLQSVADSEWSRPELRSGPPSGKGPAKAAFSYYWQKPGADLRAELVRETPAYKAARAHGADEASALKAGLEDGALAALQQTKTRLEAAFLAIDPRDGAVRAWVGSRDFDDDHFDHVAQARRQPGSTFKPFVYGAALQSGLTQTSTFVDSPVGIVLGDGRTWTPTDMGGSSGAMLTLRDGLARSKNTITAQVMQQIGPRRVVEYARAMGIEQAPLDPVPSLALGTSPVSLLEMAHAYSTFANLGVKHQPTLIASIDDRDGHEVARFVSPPERVLSGAQAAEVVDILRDAVDIGTGTMLRSKFGLKFNVAGKTGTTQNYTDGWFIAMKPSLVAGAWIGFNDQRVTMRSSQWGQGGHSALLIVGDFLQVAAKDGLVDTKERFPDVPRPVRIVPPPGNDDAPAVEETAPLPMPFIPGPSEYGAAPIPASDRSDHPDENSDTRAKARLIFVRGDREDRTPPRDVMVMTDGGSSGPTVVARREFEPAPEPAAPPPPPRFEVQQ